MSRERDKVDSKDGWQETVNKHKKIESNNNYIYKEKKANKTLSKISVKTTSEIHNM